MNGEIGRDQPKEAFRGSRNPEFERRLMVIHAGAGGMVVSHAAELQTGAELPPVDLTSPPALSETQESDLQEATGYN